jgi:hypothetical protein
MSLATGLVDRRGIFQSRNTCSAESWQKAFRQKLDQQSDEKAIITNSCIGNRAHIPSYQDTRGRFPRRGVDVTVARPVRMFGEAQAIWLNDDRRTITGRGGVKVAF